MKKYLTITAGSKINNAVSKVIKKILDKTLEW